MRKTGILVGVVAMGLAGGAWAETATPVTAAVAVTAPLPLSSEAEALKAALDAQNAPVLTAFYAARNYAPIWTDLRRAAFAAALSHARRHGLPEARYNTDALRDIFDAGLATGDIEASALFLRYAQDLSTGLIEPRSADRDIVIKRPEFDAPAALNALSLASDPTAYLAGLAPQHPDYARLVEERGRLIDLIDAGGWGAPLTATSTLRPGAQGPEIAVLRTRLGLMEGRDYGLSPEYDADLVTAVKAFQLRKGLADDGVIGPKTRAALNASPTDRLKQVLVNLERQRWLNLDRGARHILVNQADFMVEVVDQGETTFRSRVVIGKNAHRTQEFDDTMTHMVVNPTWHVPRSIATEEMLPRLKRNPGTLGGSYQVMTRNGTRVNPNFVNFNQFNKSNFPFVIKQRPGSANALGKVKFMFPNEFNIYLHDTPSKSLFNRDVRAYSHGCVRVQKPFELAYHLLGPQAAAPKEMFTGILNTGRERRVNLETPVPIYLTYQSVVFDEAGLAQYRGDVYGRDARVFRALTEAGVSLDLVEG